MDFRMLGPFEVLDDGGRVVGLGGDRQRQVLAVLLVRRRGVVDAEVLIDQLWPDSAPPSAATSVQVAVSKLRKALGAGRIQTRPGGYRLDVEEQEVDAGRFERLAGDGRATLQRGDAAMATRLLREALGQWRGDVLVDLPGGPLVSMEAARLGEVRAETVEALMRAELARGRHVEVVGELAELVRVYPFREALHAAFMLALYRSGRQAEALAAFRRLREVLVDELGVDPSPELVSLERRILSQDESLLGSEPRRTAHRFPTPATALVGRGQELIDLRELLIGGARLVTLTGPGGVGKTRLLLAYAERWVDEEGDDGETVFVDLTPLTDPDLVLATLANGLGVAEKGDRPLLDNLTDRLAGQRVILLLDNFERVLGAADTLAVMLARCPGLRVLVTSRQRLMLSGEHEYVVSPLGAPAVEDRDVDVISASSAVQLFVQRARAAQRDFTLTGENALSVAELCRRLDGLPLALELAAAHVKLLSPAGLVDRLGRNRRTVLSGGARDLPSRHQALDNAIGWSYDSLSDAEKVVLQECSVFVGGASIEALEASCAHLVDGDVFEQVSSLLDKSLLIRQPGNTDTPRVTMLETVRAFAGDRLDAGGDAAAARRRHADYFAALTVGARTGLWVSHDQWMGLLDGELDNLRVAMDWSLSADNGRTAARICVNIGRYWVFRGALAEGSRWLDLAMPAAAEDAEMHRSLTVWRADIVNRLGNLTLLDELRAVTAGLSVSTAPVEFCAGLSVLSDCSWQQGRVQEALMIAEQAFSAARAVGYPLLTCFTMTILGVSLAEGGQPGRGLTLLAEAERLALTQSAGYFRFMVVINLSWAEIQEHLYAQARDRLLRLAAHEYGPVDDLLLDVNGAIQNNLGWAALGLQDPRAAVIHFAGAATWSHKLGDKYMLAEGLVGMGCAAAGLHIPDLAGLAFGAAEVQLTQTGTTLGPYVEDQRRVALQHLDAEQVQDGHTRGQHIDPLTLIALAHSSTEPPTI